MKLRKTFLGLITAATLALGASSSAYADDQTATFAGGVASFHSQGTVLSGGNDVTTITGLAPGLWDVVLTWSGQHIVPDMLKTNLNGVLGTKFGFGQFVFIGIKAKSPPDLTFGLYGSTTSPMATWSAEVTATPVSNVPEPQTYALMLAGLGAIGLFITRRRKHGRKA